MTVRTSAGTTFGVSASAPATFNAAGYDALTFTPVGEVTDVGEFGYEFALVIHNPIATRGTVKRKGSRNAGTIALQLGLDTDDAGQILLKAAANSDSDYYFKVADQKGDIYYFAGQVMSFKTVFGGVDQITSASVSIELTQSAGGVDIVEKLAP